MTDKWVAVKREKVKGFKQRLGRLRTYDQLKKLLGAMAYYGCALHGKRRGYRAFDFRLDPHNTARVDYLYDDGISRGSCRIDNLHRHLTVR